MDNEYEELDELSFFTKEEKKALSPDIQEIDTTLKTDSEEIDTVTDDEIVIEQVEDKTEQIDGDEPLDTNSSINNYYEFLVEQGLLDVEEGYVFDGKEESLETLKAQTFKNQRQELFNEI
jgi:hypothetical protein